MAYSEHAEQGHGKGAMLEPGGGENRKHWESRRKGTGSAKIQCNLRFLNSHLEHLRGEFLRLLALLDLMTVSYSC